MKKQKEDLTTLTDRQLSERLLETNIQNESHLRFLCNVGVVYIFLAVFAVMYLNR